MIKLIRLEWKKNRIGKYTVKAIMLTVILFLMLLMMAGELESQETRLSFGRDMLKMSVEMFANLSFVIMASAMLASFIVSDYKNKTIHLLFSYPINRKLILGAKMAAVWIFSFAALVLSKISMYAALTAAKGFMNIAAKSITLGNGMFYVELLADSAVMVSISFVSLLVGMFMKSSKATIIAGVIIVCLTQGNIGSYTLQGNIPFYAVLLILSAVSVFLVLSQVETRDV